MLADYFKLSLRNLSHRKMRSWLTMIGIFIGIAAVVSLISLGQGLQEAIYQQFVALGANTVTVQASGGGFGPPGTLAATSITEDDLDEVQSVSGVDRAFGRLIRPASVEFNDQIRFVYVASLPEETEDREYLYGARDMRLDEGRLLEPSDGFKIMVGNKYAEDKVFGSRNLRPGDKVLVNDRSVEVVGTLERTGSPEVNIAFFMNEDQHQQIFDAGDEYDVLIARASESRDVTTVAESIKRKLRNFRGLDEGEEDFSVETSEDLLESFNNIIGIVQIVLVGIAGISLFVGGVGITTTMYTAVVERTREIGIMKAIGAKNSDVMLLFLIESGMLGLAGGIVGILIGIALSKTVEYIAVNFAGILLVQAYFPLQLIIGALIFSFAVGTMSGVMPALRASKMNPVEALRK